MGLPEEPRSFPRDLGSSPGTHIGQLPTTITPVPGVVTPSSNLLRHLWAWVYHTYIQSQINKITVKKKKTLQKIVKKPEDHKAIPQKPIFLIIKSKLKDEFLNSYDLPKWNQKDIRLTDSYEIDTAKTTNKTNIKALQTEISPSPDEFTIDFYLNFKEEPKPILLKLVHKIEEEEVFPSYQCPSQTKRRQQKTPQSNSFDEHT